MIEDVGRSLLLGGGVHWEVKCDEDVTRTRNAAINFQAWYRREWVAVGDMTRRSILKSRSAAKTEICLGLCCGPCRSIFTRFSISGV